MGQRLCEMDRQQLGRPSEKTLPDVTFVLPTLADMGLSRRQSSNFQKMATIDEARAEPLSAAQMDSVLEVVGTPTLCERVFCGGSGPNSASFLPDIETDAHA